LVFLEGAGAILSLGRWENIVGASADENDRHVTESFLADVKMLMM